MTELQQRIPNAVLSEYVHEQLIEVVHTAVGVPLHKKEEQSDPRRQSTAAEEEAEEQLDEIEEDFN